MTEEQTTKQYTVGEKVEEDGTYVCVPCGNKQEFTKGDQFPNCLDCFSDKEKEALAEGQELWERV